MNKKIYSVFIFFVIIFSAINSFHKETLAEGTNIIQKSDDVVVISNPKAPIPKNGKAYAVEEED